MAEVMTIVSAMNVQNESGYMQYSIAEQVAKKTHRRMMSVGRFAIALNRISVCDRQ